MKVYLLVEQSGYYDEGDTVRAVFSSKKKAEYWLERLGIDSHYIDCYVLNEQPDIPHIVESAPPPPTHYQQQMRDIYEWMEKHRTEDTYDRIAIARAVADTTLLKIKEK